jgi:ribonuclease P protein component
VGRISGRGAFAELQRARARGSSGPVRAVFVPAPEGSPEVFPQVGYAIGRRCGGAVVRNTLRRRARAVARAVAPELARGTYLVRLDPGVLTRTGAEFRHDVATALARAGSTSRGGRS